MTRYEEAYAFAVSMEPNGLSSNHRVDRANVFAGFVVGYDYAQKLFDDGYDLDHQSSRLERLWSDFQELMS